MGGYGATLFAAKHATHFSAVAPIMGLLDFPRGDLPAGQSYKVPLARVRQIRKLVLPQSLTGW